MIYRLLLQKCKKKSVFDSFKCVLEEHTGCFRDFSCHNLKFAPFSGMKLKL